MRARRDAAIRLLKVMMVASVAIPAAVFSYASWVAYHNAYAHADEQLWANLGVVAEHATGQFQSVELTFAGIGLLVDDLTDDQIKAAEPALHAQLRKLEKSAVAVGAILIADKDGRPLASSAVSPLPGDVSVADRDYFLAQKDQDAGTFVGKVMELRVRPRKILRRQPPPRAARRTIFRRRHGRGRAENIHRFLRPTCAR